MKQKFFQLIVQANRKIRACGSMQRQKNKSNTISPKKPSTYQGHIFSTLKLVTDNLTLYAAAKNVYLDSRSLLGLTILVAAFLNKCGVSWQVIPNRPIASSLRPCFVEASLTVEKVVLCYRVDQLVASLPSFRSIQSSLAVHKFRAAEEERCEWDHEQMCANLWCQMSWHAKCIRSIAAMWTKWSYLQIHCARI